MFTPTVRPFTPNLFQLETRDTPSVWEVNDTRWNAAFENTLPWAVSKANTNPGYDEIHIMVMTPPPGPGPGAPPPLPGFLDNPTFNSNATLVITEEVFIRGSTMQSQTVTITGVRPFLFSHTAPKTNIFGQPVPHESMVGGIIFSKCTEASGGAIRISQDQLSVVSCHFKDNKATQDGGAIHVGTNATLVVDGSGLYPPIQQSTRCVFDANEADQDGGAIEAEGIVILKKARFWGNQADRNGGAINVYGGSVNPKGHPIAVANPDVTFTWNQAGNDGGAIYFDSANGISTFTNAGFYWNEAANVGGAIKMNNGEMEITGGNFGDNRGDWGAIYIEDSKLSAWDVSFSDNYDTLNVESRAVTVGARSVLNTWDCDFIGANNVYVIPMDDDQGVWNDN
ncbi:MAG: hypothetical protein ABGY75_07905 [Gemmataceae bacterium]